MFGKVIKIAVLSLLTYLLQATTAEYLALWNVAPNLALMMIAIVSVALGRKYTFVVALLVGYLLEIMIPMLEYLNLILYPVAAMLGAMVFSDKSERKLGAEFTIGKHGTQLNPHLRTPLCAGLSCLIFEGVHLLYTYLAGVALTAGHWERTIVSVVYTTLLTGLIQFPVRWWLGVYKLKKAR
ncbi:MAG: hypothetical protein PHI98_02190 [Eubacteriales bacterium]|nr:hypothetical protein [Eubacteriales bacterium]